MQDQTVERTLTDEQIGDDSVRVQASNSDEAFSVRVSLLIVEFGGAAGLARAAGLSERVVRKWGSGESDPSRENLVRLARGVGVNLLWLATGEGQKRNDDGTTGDDLVVIPRYDLRFGAGPGRVAADDQIGEIPFSRKALRLKGVNSDHCSLGEVVGSSMERDLFHGDLFLFDRSDREVRGDGHIYALRLGDDLLVKYVQRAPGGGVFLISANQAVAQTLMVPPTTSQDGFEILGRVRISSRFWS